MNLETIENRAQEINKSIIQLTAQLNALHGHLSECSHWKTELEKQSQSEEAQKQQLPLKSPLPYELSN